MPPNDDMARIQVDLSLLSGQGTAAANQLAESMKEMKVFFQSFQASDFVDAAERMARVHVELHATLNKLQEEARAMQTRGYGAGGTSTPPKEHIPASEYRERVANSARQDDSAQQAEQTRREQAGEEHQARKDEAKQRNEANRQRDPGASEGMRHSYFGNVEIPRFGQLTMQDYIQLAHERTIGTGTAAAGIPRLGIGNVGVGGGTVGGALYRAGRAAGTAYVARELFQHASGHLTRQGINPMTFDQSGAALGYQRDSNPWSDILGVQTPFSSAGMEGARQARDTMLMRFSGGINQEQAAAISQASARAGFGGKLGSDIRMDFMAPMFRRFGVDPNQLIPFTQVLRTGTGDLSDLTSVLGDLGETARAANMDVNAAAQAIAAAGEAAQQMGGSAQRGWEFGRQFQQSTGLPATVGNQLSQNNIVQAFTAARTGLPGFVQGALPAAVRMQSQRDALMAMTQAFEPAFNDQTFDVVDPATGRKVTQRMSGTDAAIGAAANRLGINYDEAKAMMSHGDRASSVEFAMAQVGEYETNLKEDAKANRHKLLEKIPGGADRVTFNKRGDVVERDSGKKVMDKDEAFWNLSQLGNADTELIDDGKGGKLPRISALRGTAQRMGVDLADFDKAKKIDDPAERAAKIRSLIQDKVDEGKAKYEIRFTGQAEKFFKALANREHWDTSSWDEPSNTSYASPAGPTPPTDLTNAASSLDSYNPGP